MKNFWKFFSVIIAVLVLAACTDDSTVDEATLENSNTEGAVGGGDFTIAIPSDAVSMDPHGSNDVPSEQVRNEIYEGLVTQDENLEVVPLLAEDWEEVDDTTWEFTLKEGVTFHDGSEFNAEVVKANIERLLDPAVASPRSFLLDVISEINVIDEYTVEFVLDYPFSPMLNTLTHGAGNMISKELIDADYENALSEANENITIEEFYELRQKGGEAYEEVANSITSDVGTLVEREPVGTNYLQFESRDPGESTVLKKNEEYWDEVATIDTVTYKVVPEIGSRIAELETGASDFVLAVQSNNIDRIESNENLTLERNESVSFDYIGFNSSKEPFDDPLVRQAITHAFDKNAVLSGVYNNSGQRAIGPLAPGVLGYSDDIEGLEYDMDKAKELLEEAGHADGFDITLMVHDDNPERMDMAVFLQESLAELNINVNVEQLELGAFLDVTANGEHDMFVLGWFNFTGDPDNGLAPLFHSDNLGNSGNRSFFENDELDSLLDEGRQVSDENERQEIYEEAQQILIDEAAAIYVRYGENLHASSANVEGINIDSYNLFDFRNVTFTQ